MSRRESACASFLLAALLAGCSGRAYETYVAELDGALEGVTTQARGRAILLVSRRDDRADITLSVSGFGSPILAANVREAPRGQTGPVVLTLWQPGQEQLDESHPILRTWDRQTGLGSASQGSGSDATRGATSVPFDERILRALRAGNLYVNVQTRDRPSGEVRGQLLPE